MKRRNVSDKEIWADLSKKILIFALGFFVSCQFWTANRAEQAILILTFLIAYHIIQEIRELRNLENGVFHCRFKREVISEDINHLIEVTQIVRDIKVPFAPYIGLEIYDDEAAENVFYTGKIESVSWNNTTKVFFCKSQPLKHDKSRGELGEFLHDLEPWGWKLGALEWEAEKVLKEWRNNNKKSNPVEESFKL